MSYSGGGFLAGSSQGSPGGDKAQRNHALRPVTINQIHEAQHAHPDAEFIIDGVETKDVSLVACVRNLSKTATNTNYLVEDGTGQIDARQWSEQGTDDNGEDPNGVEVNTYVRILGQIKTFSGKRHITAQHVRRITDMNEILFHPVECVYVSLQSTRGPAGGAAVSRDVKPSVNPYADNNQGHSAAGGGGGAQYNDLPIAQRKIMEHIAFLGSKGALAEEGVNIHQLQREASGGQLNLNVIRDSVIALVEEGHLYATIDDDHVLPTS